MKRYLSLLGFIAIAIGLDAQSVKPSYSFMEYQKTFTRISDAIDHKEDTLIQQFNQKKLPWPAKYIYIRSFKYDSQLEVWVKYSKSDAFRLFKTYKVCALSGSLGPKRMAGDYQVPEGFYYINEFNPKSLYHLSLGLNYPNESDKLLADAYQPGGDIYIHGSCVTTGCIPITNQQIEELYILAAHAKEAGQDFIPVHIFPVRFDNAKSMDYMTRFLKDFPEYQSLTDHMQEAYNLFEKNRQVPIVMVNKKGDYLVQQNNSHTGKEIVEKNPDRTLSIESLEPKRRNLSDDEISKIVDVLPEYSGGPKEFQNYLNQLNKEMVSFLPKDVNHLNVLVEYVIDKDGTVANAKVLRGGVEPVTKKIEEGFLKMPTWKPALRNTQNVAVKMKQTLILIK
jgi:murein L,D-transpeptidase YafK